MQFRATGPERGGGNLQLWYAKDGQAKIGTSSIYTVGPFDGFALVIDAHGGTVSANPIEKGYPVLTDFFRVEALGDSSMMARRTTEATTV